MMVTGNSHARTVCRSKSPQKWDSSQSMKIRPLCVCMFGMIPRGQPGSKRWNGRGKERRETGETGDGRQETGERRGRFHTCPSALRMLRLQGYMGYAHRQCDQCLPVSSFPSFFVDIY